MPGAISNYNESSLGVKYVSIIYFECVGLEVLSDSKVHLILTKLYLPSFKALFRLIKNSLHTDSGF